ncbi:MAG: hypothetical protein ABIZ34_10370, partial [Candidatus Limnocylindrales bacterium]
DGGRGVVVVRDGEASVVAPRAGPLGPTINRAAAVAFRAELESGAAAVCAWALGAVAVVAESTGRYAGFQGLPVINGRGDVCFRADLAAGGHGIHVANGVTTVAVVETGDDFSDLGRFPFLGEDGTVAFCGTRRDGGPAVLVASEGTVNAVIDTRGAFEDFRGVLMDGTGRVVFYATPRGGQLGVFSGPDPIADRVVGLGTPLFGSPVDDFVLNPVSINAAGRIAIRAKLADGRHVIVRADPTS